MLTFSCCLRHSKLPEIKKILEEDDVAILQQVDSEGHTLVHWAALAGHVDLVKFLVDSGAPINEHSRNDYGPCPIHWGCVNGHIGVIGFFLDRGIPVDTADLNGCSPLIIAAQYGQSLAISYLLQKGANRFHTDVNGDGALHWAAFKGRWVELGVIFPYLFAPQATLRQSLSCSMLV